jgi:xanthine dehydrogenase accessory factor
MSSLPLESFADADALAGARAGPGTGEWLAPLAGHWTDAARTLLSRHPAVIRLTVVALRGSAPREAGASMLVDPVGTVGTIGGGQLEWQATRAARELLAAREAPAVRLEDLILGPDLGQCCGGRVELWLERLTHHDLPWLNRAAKSARMGGSVALTTHCRDGAVTHRVQRAAPGADAVSLRRGACTQVTLVETLTVQRACLWIFGAGHVGQALVRLLADLGAFDITWVDSRSELLPVDLGSRVTIRATASPVDRIRTAPPGTHYVVLTHDHALDYELCRTILLRRDAASLGLIGSASKAARFRSRLLREGIDRETQAGLTCPIGIPGIASKLPAAIAIAIAAQLLQHPPRGPARRQAAAAQEACPQNCGGCASGTHRKA